MHEKIFYPANLLLNRLNYTKKFTLLWVLSMAALSVVVYGMSVRVEGIIQPLQRELEGIALITPISKTVQSLQLHRGISSALLSGGGAMRDRRAAQERKVAEAFKALQQALPPGMASGEAFRRIEANWARLREEGLNWTAGANFDAHTDLIAQIQSFEVAIADKYGLSMEQEIGTLYLLDTSVSKLPRAIEYLGQIRAYGTGVLVGKQATEQQKIKLQIIIARLDGALAELGSNLEKAGLRNQAIRLPISVMHKNVIDSAQRLTDLVASDILGGRFATPAEAFLDMATAQIDSSYTQLYETLLPAAEALVKQRIDKAENELRAVIGLPLLALLMLIYLTVSIYYNIIGAIQSLVRSARAFAAGDLIARVRLDTRDELSLVGDSFNEMADGFNAMLEARRAGEAHLRATIETAMDAVVQMNSAGIITGWNSQAEKIFGWSRDEALGRALHETIIPPRYREAHVQGLARFLRSGEGAFLNALVEIMALHRDGHEFAVELAVAAIKTAGGYEFSAFIRDITERKQAQMTEQRRLDELEALYLLGNAVSSAESLDQIHGRAMDFMLRLLKADWAAILLFDAEGVMRFMAWRGLSDAYRQAADGYSPWTQDAVDPQPVFVEDIKLDASLAHLHPAAAAEGIRAFGFVPLVQHDRLLGKFMVNFNAPHRFSKHEIQLAMTIAGHVALAIDRKRAEQQFADIFEFAPDAIIMTDKQGITTLANQQADQLFGYAHEELIGRPIDILLPQDAQREHLSLRQKFLAHVVMQGSVVHEPANGGYNNLQVICKDGSTFQAEISLSPMEGQNGLMIAAAVRDVSERQQVLERLRATAGELEQANALIEEERAQLAERVTERTAQLLYANKAKDSFLATMSHEIRTPLGGLLGMMELISLSQLDDSQREMLHAARDSGNSLLRIVNDILDWSKIEAGKLELSPQAATIPDILKSVVSTYSPLASAKELMLRQRVDSKLGAAHIFDPLRLSQILNNFTSNAIKFTEQGAVEISAERMAQHDGNEEVRFCVKDSGVGISPEHQAHLFEFYEQGGADTARMYGGTGLGLAISHRLAELMEGTISVESTPGRGSIFCLTLDLPVASPAVQRDVQLRRAREEDSDENTSDITPLVKDGRQVSVLLVDDHPMNRKLLKQQLELLGIHAEDAAQGIVAMSLWWTGRFDLIITDCHMPEMDGYELTRSIREMEQHDARQRMPIIAWTANVLAEEEQRCRAAGMDDILTKPTELAELRAMLLKWLDKADLSAAAAPPPETIPDYPLDAGRVSTRHVVGLKPDLQPDLQSAQNPASAEAAIDFSVLKKIAKRHAAQVEMLQEFNLCNRADIANLKAALQEGNPAAAARSAHCIKGACRMVGAVELDGICTAIETAATQGDLERARQAAIPLDEAIARVEAAVSAFIAAQ